MINSYGRSTYFDTLFKKLKTYDELPIEWHNVNENSVGEYNITEDLSNKNVLFKGYLQSCKNFIHNSDFFII